MQGYRFDPTRLARPASALERDGYAIAGRMLRDHVGDGDIFAEARERTRRDPVLRAMFAHAADLLTQPTGPAGVPRLRARRRRRP
jgi:hypothetical protein